MVLTGLPKMEGPRIPKAYKMSRLSIRKMMHTKLKGLVASGKLTSGKFKGVKGVKL